MRHLGNPATRRPSPIGPVDEFGAVCSVIRDVHDPLRRAGRRRRHGPNRYPTPVLAQRNSGLVDDRVARSQLSGGGGQRASGTRHPSRSADERLPRVLHEVLRPSTQPVERLLSCRCVCSSCRHQGEAFVSTDPRHMRCARGRQTQSRHAGDCMRARCDAKSRWCPAPRKALLGTSRTAARPEPRGGPLFECGAERRPPEPRWTGPVTGSSRGRASTGRRWSGPRSGPGRCGPGGPAPGPGSGARRTRRPGRGACRGGPCRHQ